MVSEVSWYRPDRIFIHQRVIEQWIEMVCHADQQGQAAIQVIGNGQALNTFQGEQFEWYEWQVRESMRHERRLLLYAYPAAQCTPDRMLQVIRGHSHALFEAASQTWSRRP